MATVRMTGKMITISMADHVLSDQFMAAIVTPMADVEFQPYLNYGKHKRTFLWRRTWTKSKIPTSYKNNLQQSPLKGRLRRAATTVSATECSNPATTFAAWSLWGLDGFLGAGGFSEQRRRRIRIRAHCNKSQNRRLRLERRQYNSPESQCQGCIKQGRTGPENRISFGIKW